MSKKLAKKSSPTICLMANMKSRFDKNGAGTFI